MTCVSLPQPDPLLETLESLLAGGEEKGGEASTDEVRVGLSPHRLPCSGIRDGGDGGWLGGRLGRQR